MPNETTTAPAPQPRHPRGPGKCPSGIRGLDEITGGGVPRGRPTLVCGGAGCGKTLLAMEFLVRGAVDRGEPGIFIAFEESPEELARNVASLGYDLRNLVSRKLLFIEHIALDGDAEETGEFTLDGIFARLQHAVDQVKPKRIVLDTIENLFSGFSNIGIVRAEVRRLFQWIKDHRLTAIVTAERGDGDLTRQGIEEYVSDCVILLDHRVHQQLATRRLRVVKYRGSQHGTDEYPFVIDERGIVVVPVTSLKLDQPAPARFVSSGIAHLDQMLGGKGYYAGSTVLISGGAGTGKTSFAVHFVDRSCRRGTKSMYFAFEESMQQIMRSMNSIGVDLKRWVDQGQLQFCCTRPTLHGLEMHLASMYGEILRFGPKAVVIDPITDLTSMGSNREVHAMLTRLIDFLKGHGITAVLTGLSHSTESMESAAVGISSLIDTWIELRGVEFAGERNRTLFVCKARGMAHSNQIREFQLSNKGIQIVDVCVGPRGILTGSARVAHEMQLESAAANRNRRTDALRRQITSRREVVRARIAALSAELDAEISALEAGFELETGDETRDRQERTALALMRNTTKAAKQT